MSISVLWTKPPPFSAQAFRIIRSAGFTSVYFHRLREPQGLTELPYSPIDVQVVAITPPETM
ncbi:MAG: hypothetical protein LBT47_12265 [Deltaproteobacteria bacterium]|nr:hypothetical protein [Deltaproteobacteria bacterium]